MKLIVMLGTSPSTMGGISSVVRVLGEGGLFERCPIRYITTHKDGSRVDKLVVAVRGWFTYLPLLLAGRIGLLHVHLSSRASFWRKSLFILPAYLRRVPVILHLHGGEFHIFFGQECGVLSRLLVRHVFERATRVVVLSEAWRAWVMQQFPACRVQVIYNPVTLPSMTSEARRGEACVLFLGRIWEKKGAFHVIAAVAKICERFPHLRLCMGGDSETDKAMNLARELGIADRVELLGWVTGEEKDKYLRQASVFVLPSYNEGLPMAVLEAMAYGIPVVATPVGGIPEAITDGVEGFLVPPGDEVALADRLQRLLSDPALRDHMGRAARQKAEHVFSTEVVVPKFETLYAELMCAASR